MALEAGIILFVVFAVILYMSQIAPFVWVTLVFLVSVATVFNCNIVISNSF